MSEKSPRSYSWPLPDSSYSLVDHFRSGFSEEPEKHTYRYLVDGEGEPLSLTNAEFDRRCRAVAAHLRSRHAAGERALIVCPAGLDYVVSFVACLYANVIAVPVYPPNPALLQRTLPRLLAILDDAGASCVLAPAEVTSMVDRFAEYAPRLRDLDWVSVDEIDVAEADDWHHPGVTSDDIAFLQYTSGSTSTPKGVMVGHGNLLHNIACLNGQLFRGTGPDDHMVTWLPPYHDMGLIAGLLAPAVRGYPVTFMSPFSFLKRPQRWIDAMSRFGATVTGAPNFAYELCVSKIDADHRRTLDLSRWRVAYNGAEPIRLSTLDRFSEVFAEAGFRRSAFEPAYGLAEGTLMVSGAGERPTQPPVSREVSAERLRQHTIAPPSDGADAHLLVGCGTSIRDQRVVIADPETGRGVEDGRVGEIWVSGPSVAHGYWRRPELTEQIFRAHLADTGEGPFLRTGDLGFVDGDEVYVTGRIKDVIIIDGANYYPQDIERTVEQVHPVLRRGCGVAGARTVDGQERVLVIQELGGKHRDVDLDAVALDIRTRVQDEHGIAVSEIALVGQGKVPKTSSGKLQRSACLDALVDGSLSPVLRWSAIGGATDRTEKSGAPEPRPARPSGTELEQRLAAELAGVLGVAPDTVDVRAPFAGFGLRSVELVSVIGTLEGVLGRSLPATLAYEHPTIERLAAFLAEEDGSDAAAAETATAPATEDVTVSAREPGAGAAPPEQPEPAGRDVAIVGIGCRFPGGANDPESFWRLLRDGRDAITEVPAQRWSVDDFFDPDPAVPGRTDARWGGFCDHVDSFDPAFFGISHHEASRMDPQQRLLAEVTWEALEDAGLPAARLAGTDTGVFVGVSSFDYAQLAIADLSTIDGYTATGSALSITANRLSYLLDLRGPSMAVDTACSSSLVAVIQAVRSLRSGECDVALAGGVNLILSPAFAINFSKAGMMSPDGRCKPFSADANGFVRSEGAGVVVLKPLDKALADGDLVYGVIRGGALSQDGRSNGINAPSPRAQEAVLRAAYADAGVPAARVDYVEAHGTGTILGDPIEAKALGAVIGAGRDPDSPCVVGSVKSNVGHMESAAGVGGLIKAALMLRHRRIPRTVHYRTPNPHIPFRDLGLVVADDDLDWPSTGRAGLVGVSSFGFGGTNAHVVLEQAPEPEPGPGRRDARAGELLTLSAATAAALRDVVHRYRDRLTGPEPDLTAASLASATGTRRDHHTHRLACVVETPAAARERLDEFLREGEADDVVVGVSAVRNPRTAFVLSGQGKRWWPLAADLVDTEPVFRSVLERCDALLRRHVDWSLLRVLAVDGDASELTGEDVRQPALCAVQIALATLWRSWGVEPAAVVGHSVGEVAAAHVAGALSLGDALLVALRRGEAVATGQGPGLIAVVDLPYDDLTRTLAARRESAVWPSGANSPYRSLVAGEHAAVRALVTELEESGTRARVLDSVGFASHTPLMEPVAAELWRTVSGLRPRPCALPLYSTVHGGLVDGGSLDAEYWAENLTSPVLFDQAVARMVEDGFDAFVEISPHPALRDGVVERLELDEVTGVAVSSLHRDESGVRSLLTALGGLYVAGYPVDFRRVHGTGPRVALPTYPWQRVRCWLDAPSRPALGTDTGHPALQTHVRAAAEPRATYFSGRIDLAGFGYLADHVVAGATVLPAAFVLDAALAAARHRLGGDRAVVEDVRFDRPTVVSATARQETAQFVLSDSTAEAGSFRLFTRDGEDPAWTAVARGSYRLAEETPPTEPGELEHVRSRCRRAVDLTDRYATLRESGLEYGPAFRGLAALDQGDGEALATLHDRSDLTSDTGAHVVHPTVLDACLQAVAGALDSTTLSRTYVPAGVDRFAVSGARATVRFAHAVVGTVDDDAGEVTGCRVVLYDDSGCPVGELSGLRLSAVDGSSGADGGSAPVLRLRWDAEEPEDTATHRDASEGWWLLFADTGDVAGTVRRELERRGGTCVLLGRGGRDTSRPEELAAALEEARVGRSGPCAGIVFAWALDATDDPDGSVEHATAAVTAINAVAGTFPEAPRFLLLTRGAQRVVESDTVDHVGQAPLWGLTRVAVLEHPELRPTVLDLDPAADAGKQVVDELLRPAGTDTPGQAAWRAGHRYTPSLEPWQPETGSGSWPRRPFDPERHANHRLLAENPGILGSLVPARLPDTPPAPGQVRIEVAGTGLNFSDVLKAMGVCPGFSGVVPLGAECVGRITAVGGGTEGVSTGDRVLAVGPSSMARSMTTDARLVAPCPDGLSDEEAAAVPVAFLTAVYALEHCARLRRGETVLIHYATGGVGLAALQVARRAGATVFATAGTETKRALLRELGVEHVMDSRSLDFADEIARITEGRGVDVVLNSTAGEALFRSVELLAPGGRFAEIGKRDIYGNSHLGLELLKHNRAFFAIDLEEMIHHQRELLAELFTEVVRGFADGDFTALPVTSYPYAEAERAFSTMARAEHIGKLVVTPSDVAEVAEPPGQDPVTGDGTYLITGGLGALGLVTARYLVERGARHLVLVGRRAPSAEARKAIAGLEERGARVVVRSADVAVADDVHRLVAEIRAELPPLSGIVHAAGILDDGLLCDLDAERMASVAGPKVRGAWNLHRATEDVPLDLFVCYSSVASLLGSLGQGNYAAANAFLDALAAYRRDRGLAGLSVNWGPWAGDSMASAVVDGMAAKGVLGLGRDEAVEALDTLVRSSTAGAAVLSLDVALLRKQATDTTLSVLLREFAAPTTSADDVEDDQRGSDVRRALLAVEPGRRRTAILVDHCLNTAARVLKADPAGLDPRAPLAGAGFDSLLSLELRKRLESSLGIALPPTFAWRYPTVEALVPFLAERMEIPLRAADADAAPAGAPPGEARSGADGADGADGRAVDDRAGTATAAADGVTESASADLDSLTEAELEQLLLAKTDQLDEGLTR